MMKDVPPPPPPDKKAKSDIVNKGLTAAGASLLASELVLGDGVDDKRGVVTQQRGGSAGVGDGSDKGYNGATRGGGKVTIHVICHTYCVTFIRCSSPYSSLLE